MKNKISQFMMKALKAIEAGGGSIKAMPGGWWSVDGGATHCTVEPEPGSASGIVGTHTVKSLCARGLLYPDYSHRTHWAIRSLTMLGRSVLEVQSK